MNNLRKLTQSIIVKRVIFCLIALLVIIQYILLSDSVFAAETGYEVLENLEFENFDNWCKGCFSYVDGYPMDGKYEYRIRLKDFVTFEGAEYKVEISDPDYKMLIRELDTDFNFIRSIKLKNEDLYYPSEIAKYLAIGIYNTKNDKAMSYDLYGEMFENGFKVLLTSSLESGDDPEEDIISDEQFEEEQIVSEEQLEEDKVVAGEDTISEEQLEEEQIVAEEEIIEGEKVSEEEFSVEEIQESNDIHEEEKSEASDGDKDTEEITEEEIEEYLDVSEAGLNDFENWVPGCYSWVNGQVMEGYKNRLRLNNYVTASEKNYKLSLTSSKVSMLIRELDANMGFLKSNNISSGSEIELDDDTIFLAITLYVPSKDSSMTYEEFENIFNNGIDVSLEAASVNEEDNVMESDTEKVGDELKDNNEEKIDYDNLEPTTENLKLLLKMMYTTDDTDVHDVSAWNLKDYEFMRVNSELLKEDEEFYIAYYTGRDCYMSMERENEYVKSVWFVNKDDDYAERYELARAAVERAMSGIKEEMSDLEKVLVLNDYIIENTYYAHSGTSNYAGDTLAYGKGVCGGYSRAYGILLTVAGIESHMVTSSDHAWTMVMIDGEQYHVDTTWGDTKSKSDGTGAYANFIRNDSVFSKTHQTWSAYGKDNTSKGTTYDNWFVHDVKGRMKYCDGYWYYVLNGSIIKSRIDGTEAEVLIKSDKSLKVVGVEDDKLNYIIGGKVQEMDI